MECVIVGEADAGSSELCGITIRERLRRTLRQCGGTEWPKESWPEGNFLAVRGDHVFEPQLLRALIDANEPAALVDANAYPPAAVLTRELWLGSIEESIRQGLADGKLRAIDVQEMPKFIPSMHREVPLYWFPAPGSERVILDAAQKGTLDIPAYAHAPIETWIVSKLCRTSLKPNQLTFFCNVIAWVTTILFATGHLVAGVLLALAVGVLDGLDGKLARVKLETSKAGELEHLFDVVFEYSWWLGLAFHFRAWPHFGLLVAAEILTALARNRVARAYGISICDLAPFDRFVRLVGGRRNIYIWIFAIGVLLGAPAGGFRVIAWWSVATAAVQVPRALLALALRDGDRRRP